MSEAIGRFYRALSDLRRLPEQVAAGPGSVAPLHAPLDWLRETIARAGNHFAELDAAAESLAGSWGTTPRPCRRTSGRG